MTNKELLIQIATRLEELQDRGRHDSLEYEKLQEDWEAVAEAAMMEEIMGDDDMYM